MRSHLRNPPFVTLSREKGRNHEPDSNIFVFLRIFSRESVTKEDFSSATHRGQPRCYSVKAIGVLLRHFLC